MCRRVRLISEEVCGALIQNPENRTLPPHLMSAAVHLGMVFRISKEDGSNPFPIICLVKA